VFKGHIVIGSDYFDITVTRLLNVAFCLAVGEEGQEIKGQEEGEKGQRQEEGASRLCVATVGSPALCKSHQNFPHVIYQEKKSKEDKSLNGDKEDDFGSDDDEDDGAIEHVDDANAMGECHIIVSKVNRIPLSSHTRFPLSTPHPLPLVFTEN
jgi:hypothetical protein